MAFLEKKLKEHEAFYATEVAKLKEALDDKVREVENLKGEVAKQYIEGFYEALNKSNSSLLTWTFPSVATSKRSGTGN